MDIGIDLGTTFSVIAVNGRVELAPDYPPGIYLEECDVTIVPSPLGEPTFPSVVVENPDRPGAHLFGTEALMRLEEGFAPVMFSKRKIGTREMIPLGGGRVVARDVATLFLRYLKDCAERALGGPVARAVVTHPAYFDRAAVEETREAAIAAGFDMSLTEQMLMEPVAAALTYTRTDTRDPLRVLTYDLGGGTFDVTYLERRSGVIDVRAFDGDHLLGGYNFDRALVHWLRKNLEAKGRRIRLDEDDPADRARLARLLRLAEQVKLDLAKARTGGAKVDFRVRGILADADGKDIQVNERISRDELVQIIAPLLQETVEGCRRALSKAGVDASELDEILLVGGSTYGPWISEALAQAFPGVTPKLFIPDLCVGAGAAIHAKMVLPALVCDRACRLELEVPDSVTLDTVNVAGRITGADGRAWRSPATLTLQVPRGGPLGPIPLGPDGRFLFEDVELGLDAGNNFLLRLEDPQHGSLLEHRFQVRYAPETTETSGVSTVLPKPLFIETLDGFVPLAAEGVTLPAQCEQTFQRENDNPNISLKLFQGRHPIGEVRIENIPLEGGRGAFVDLKVQVTEKNEIRGVAMIRTAAGRLVHQALVHVIFDVPEIASVDRLEEEFDSLKVRIFALMLDASEAATQILEAAPPLIARVEELFQQQPVERQEIAVALRRLHDLLVPPKDDMEPTREAFCAEVAACRGRITELRETARAVQQDHAGESRPMDPGTVSALRLAQKAERLAPMLDKLERDGLDAHSHRDRKAWGRAHESIESIIAQLRDPAPARVREVPPTSVSKMMMIVSILKAQKQLEERAARFAREGRLGDWEQELNRIQAGLQESFLEVQGIDDTLEPEQGLAQVRRTYQRLLHPFEDAITKLGIDIRKV